MALSFDSSIKELQKNPKAVEICKKYGLDVTDVRIAMVKDWSARKVAELPGSGMTPDKRKALEEELKAANL